MLDDLRKIHERDTSDALGIAEKQPAHYSHTFGFTWSPPRTVREVIVAGMGGSGLGAKAYKVIPGVMLPFDVVQDYDLPERTTASSLLICSSYSGNTEETIAVLTMALARPDETRPMIIVITSGGALQAMAQTHGLPLITLPGGYQPRHTFGYQYRALAEVMQTVTGDSSLLAKITAAAQNLEAHISDWIPTVATKDNLAKQIALELMGKSVVVYAGPKLAPAAYKWKISLNENAKHIAWWNQYPELNHNEFMGWTKQPVLKPYAVIELRSKLEHPRIQERFELTDRMLSGLRPHPEVVEAVGGDLLEHMLYAIALGDFVSIYLALLSNIDPTPVDLIEKLKTQLG